MKEIYCHIHTPINIEEENNHFLQPLLFSNNLYIIKEKKLEDTFLLIGLFQEFLQFVRENGSESIPKWLNKKNLMNEGFLEAVSQYWIEDIALKQISNYKYFQKNKLSKPVIPDKYLKNIFQKVLLNKYVQTKYYEFNEKAEEQLNLIEKELSSINDENHRNLRKNYYQNKIFEILLDNYHTDADFNEKLQDLNNINFSCETLLTHYDLFVYKTGNINEYKDFNFKLTKTCHTECLRENTFVKLYANSGNTYCSDSNLNFILEELKTYSQIFTRNVVDFGVEHLKKIINYENSANKKRAEVVNYKTASSKVELLQRTQTIISETEDHIISRYDSLKNHTNIYFAPSDELSRLVASINLNEENLNRLNNLLREKSNTIEAELINFTFKKGNLPYSAYGFACLNF